MQPKTTKQAGAKPQAAGSPTRESTEAFQLEHPVTSVQQVQFAVIIARPQDYAFRGGSLDNPFSEVALRSLKENIKSYGGISTPLLLRAYADGTFLLCDGHRRYFSLEQLIKENVEGFSRDMLLPANVLTVDTSELVTVATSLSANVERLSLSFEGRLDATAKLNQLGMPKRAIAELLHVTDSTVDRDLLLAQDGTMRLHISNHRITATNAATLLALAESKGRRELFMDIFNHWMAEADEQLEAEDEARAERDEPPLTGAKRWLQNRMPPGQIKAWRAALEQGNVSAVPEFRFKAMLRREGGPPRIEIDGLAKNIDELSLGDVAKVLRRCLDLAAELEPILAAKSAEQEQGSAGEGKGGRKLSPGQQRLKELGFAEIVGESENPEDDVGEDDVGQPNEGDEDADDEDVTAEDEARFAADALARRKEEEEEARLEREALNESAGETSSEEAVTEE